MPHRATPSLRDRHILVVEDEFFVAEEMARELEEAGATIVGPVGTVDDALDCVASGVRIDAAILDINLRGDLSYPVAEALRQKQVPFLFATGYDAWSLDPGFRDVTRCEKPIDPSQVARALFPVPA